ncbi:MAG TPA: TIGR03560 family F420-dependent LLM class oxidoreductase [Dermatophilaceae bacterium]|nr:TIGR03560 family F420-dependent LLM class oxidoreductase [Dermatophilaceae bacterium]
MKISLNVTNYTWPGGAAATASALGEVAEAADSGGLDTLWVNDHLLQADPRAQGDRDMLEAYTVLGYLAGQTTRIGLGAMVSAVTFRAPAVLLKAVTTLDVLSGGRAWLGIGAGYQQAEAEWMGLDLPPTVERFERLEETLQLAEQMAGGDESPFEGRHYRLARPESVPQPLQRPRVRVLVGGAGERRTLPLVARYADACNLFDIPDGGKTLRRKLEVLRRQCEELGRPYREVEKTVSTALQPDETASAFTDRCAAFRDLGVDHVVVITQGAWKPATVGVLVEAAAATRAG